MGRVRAPGHRVVVPKERTTPEAAAAAFGAATARRHILLCAGPDCTPPEQGERAWEYLKGRLKALGLSGAGGSVYRTRCHCLRICTGGPIAVVYPEGAWYREATPENLERILQEHVIGGRIVTDLCFARGQLFPAAGEPSKL